MIAQACPLIEVFSDIADFRKSRGKRHPLSSILALACCAPRPVLALEEAFRAGDHVRARRIQEAVTPLGVAVTATYGVAGLKLAMDLAGQGPGRKRLPDGGPG